MEDQSLVDVLIRFITSFETLIAVMIGAGIGFIGNVFTLWYKSREEEKKFKRKKLEELYKLTLDLWDYYNEKKVNVDSMLLRDGEMIPLSDIKDLRYLGNERMVIDLYLPNLRTDFDKLHSQITKFETMCVEVYNFTDAKDYQEKDLKNFYKEFSVVKSRLNNLIMGFLKRLSDESKNL